MGDSIEDNEPTARRFISWPVFAALAIPVAAICSLADYVFTSLEQIFKDFKMEVPASTKMVLLFSRWMNIDYGWAYLCAVVLIVPFIHPRLVNPPSPERKKLHLLIGINIGLMFGLILGYFLLWTSISPMYELVQSVSAPHRQ
jgi:hypothetical protein